LPLLRFRLKCPRPKAYSENPKTLGEHLKKRRLELELTQKQAAQALGVNHWTVMNWEAGRFHPLIRWLPAILRFLGYDPFPVPTTVGERLLQKRRQHGWSTSEAARQFGVDRTTWEGWERGKLILFRKRCTKVATFLGLDPKELAVEMRTRWNGKHRRWARGES
jgi:transcriptional regulator with XRE-family HTH domain